MLPETAATSGAATCRPPSAASAADATDLYLKAQRTSVTVPVSATATTTVPMWTYSRCDADFTTNCVSLLDGGGSAGPLVSVPCQPRSRSLMLVLERVWASTRLTMMAAYML